MKKHFLSVVIPFVLFSTSAKADLMVDIGGVARPSSYHVIGPHVIGPHVIGHQANTHQANINSVPSHLASDHVTSDHIRNLAGTTGASSLSWRSWSPASEGTQIAMASQSSQQQDPTYTTYPTERTADRYQDGQVQTRTVVTSRVITEQPVRVANSQSDLNVPTRGPVHRLMNVTEAGSTPSSVQSAGWANGMPISLAIRQIVPSDFKLRENDVLGASSVSWSGDRAWPVVLDELAARNNFVAHIDWNRREVSLAPSMGRPAAQHTKYQDQVVITQEGRIQEGRIQEGRIQENRSRETIILSNNTISHSSSHSKDNAYSKDSGYRPTIIKTGVASVTSVVNTGGWVLDPKYTLKENIQAWGERAGWRVVWEGADYPIVAAATFTGDFASPAGPVAKLIAAYETSDQPLVANLTTLDRVLYVKNKYYNQQEVVPTSPGEMTPELFGKKD